MSRQDKKIYSSLINKIAIVLIFNQGLFVLLGSLIAWLEGIAGDDFDMIFRLLECVAYFVAFTAPVYLFNKMNKNAEREVYEPRETAKARPLETVFMIGITLGMIMLAAYANYYIVNAFGNYSDFTHEYFWSVDLTRGYQIVIYFIYAAVIPAVVEELLFRGTVCKSLTIYGKGTGVVISALLFALMHSNVEQLLYTFAAGLLLGWIYVETKNLVFPMLAHFINNGMSAVGDIIYEKCPASVYNAYDSISNIALWIFTFVSLIGFLFIILKRGYIFKKMEMKPDENGCEVAPLSISERVCGFFSVGMVLFIAYSFLMMTYYIYLSKVV